MTAAVLTQYGYRALTASDGAEAVATYAQHRTEILVVITDIMMPVVDGVALCRVLRKMDSEVCLIVSSGYADESRLGELRSLNVREVLYKPFSSETLVTAIGEALSTPTVGLLPPALQCA